MENSGSYMYVLVLHNGVGHYVYDNPRHHGSVDGGHAQRREFR